MIMGNEFLIWQKKRSTLIVDLSENGFQSISKPKKDSEAKKVANKARKTGEDPIEAFEVFSSGL
ncbi:DNA topoisomerase [Schizosaccharomyces osmophilus]|uniref:DNA topoisomerase n=1 Tax=Schizosaccharomyces osmophilus TaxID=2545709 RepID=A0AAE9W7H5_9SCHI|nr:DNA topoisomerase [Schizosaccharomyces osmophilus]WBW71249.1 DNA topoisomerase [Schizosaccharomyces osmophilus]